MAMMPKRMKFRKHSRGRVRGNATRGNSVAFGDFGLQSLSRGWITGRQIEAGRVAANRALDGEGKVFIRIFPHKPVTSTPEETRMGKGKGEPEYYVAIVRPGTVLFEIAGASQEKAKTALARTAHKMPVQCRLVERKHKR